MNYLHLWSTLLSQLETIKTLLNVRVGDGISALFFKVEVQYVDYGNTEQLPVSSLREPARAIGHVNSLPFQVSWS